MVASGEPPMEHFTEDVEVAIEKEYFSFDFLETFLLFSLEIPSCPFPFQAMPLPKRVQGVAS